MALKPDLNPANVQNVVVYVSNDNFAQSYTVEENVPQAANLHPPGYPMASMGQTKNFPENKTFNGQDGYFNGYVNYPNCLKHDDRAQNDRNVKCDRYADPYLTIVGPEVSSQSVRCDSVRSETAESSCSSLSSTDEGMVVVQNPSPEMVVYDPSVSVRPGGVVLVTQSQQHHASGGAAVASAMPQSQHITTVPYGWKRLINNGSVIYISPSNTALSSLEQVKAYLLSSGTCKCGLECHFKYDTVFNFDPKVMGKPWVMSPDTNTGDLTHLCNHKRKMALASLDKPPDPDAKIRKDYSLKKKKRKIGVPLVGGISVSQILAQREKQQHQLALEHQPFNKEIVTNPQQVWPPNSASHNHVQNFMDTQPVNPMLRCPESGGRMMPVPPGMDHPTPNQGHSPNIHIHQQQIIAPNGQIINVQDFPHQNNMVVQNQLIQGQNGNVMQHNRFNSQPSEPSGPGRPGNMQMIGQQIKPELKKMQHMFHQQQFDVDSSKNVRPMGLNGMRPQMMPHQNQLMHQMQMHNRMQWPHRMQNQHHMNQMQIQQQQHPQLQQQQPNQNVYERVPPLHQHPNPVWQEEIRRKKVKLNKQTKNRQYVVENNCQLRANAPCPNVDVRQIPNENNRQVVMNQVQQHNHNSSSPSFMEDPSGYLAQQTALLNNTINRQTVAAAANNLNSYECSSSSNNIITISNPTHEMAQMNMMKQQMGRMNNHQIMMKHQNHLQQQPHLQRVQYNSIADSSLVVDPQYIQQCHGCIPDQKQKNHSRSDSAPSTPSSCGTSEDPVTSSVYSEKHHIHSSQPSPDTRPIQGGTVSTSNVSPMDSIHSDPPTPKSIENFSIQNHDGQIVQIVSQSRENYIQQQHEMQHQQDMHKNGYSSQNMPKSIEIRDDRRFVTTMASGRTSGCNTITSVVAGRANTATVSVNNNSTSNTPPTSTINFSKSPLEMVQSVVSSIQVPQSQHQHQNITVSISQTSPQISPHIVKHSPTGLPPGHILVSSNGQLIMASTGNGQANVMAPPPPPKVVASQPPVSVSPIVTNVLGQQTVLVNTLPAPFVIQPMTMDVGQNVQLPQIVAGNVIQQQIHLDSNTDQNRRLPALLSPETKKKGKKRKLPSQTVAGMLHIAAQQNSGMVVNQQGFPQQIQVHSPQNITTPVMQALTIVPSKNGPPQIVMNGGNAQQIITNSQPTQQINLLQPVSLLNGTVQNIPIQQFIVPNLGGSMVMNADGTATILQDTSNLGMQLQIQNVNGQNVLTPIQNMGGQSILAAGPAGMVIRAPTSQGKIIQQQHSPGAQFLSPNGSQFVVNGQFNGQLSPLVAGGQQVTFNTSPQQIRNNNNQQEYIQVNGQMGQTLMVPCTPQPTSSSNQNTTFVHQNTTIVQQQTTMVANNQQLQSFQQNNQQGQQNVNNQQLLLQRTGNEDYRQSVSTQTAVNQNSQSVTTNAFCQTSNLTASSPPDTTTLSPIASGGQSPPTADTTTHTGSTDDGLSPAPSNCSATCSSEINVPGRPGSRTMAMVHCVSSSEQDLLDSNPHVDQDWRKVSQSSHKEELITMRHSHEFTDVSNGHMHFSRKQQNIGHMTYDESNNMVGIQFLEQKLKQDVIGKHYGKLMHQHQKRGHDVMLVMNNGHMTLFDEDDATDKETTEKIQSSPTEMKHAFKPGDLVWGPTKGSSSWPGKVIQIVEGLATVKWFGSDRNLSKIKVECLQTLSEGFEAHHAARKNARTSRKLNTQLEKAIQEAMAELDKNPSTEETADAPDKVVSSTKQESKKAGRLRSGQR